jgi:hypothetical protein
MKSIAIIVAALAIVLASHSPLLQSKVVKVEATRTLKMAQSAKLPKEASSKTRRSAGYLLGYRDGWHDAKEVYWPAGFNAGWDAGYEAGHEQGMEDCEEGHEDPTSDCYHPRPWGHKCRGCLVR